MSRTVTVKIGKSSVEVHLDSDGTTEDVKRVVEERTGVVARKQKLMFKGKVLLDGETLEAAGIRDGAKIMGIATEATQTQVLSCDPVSSWKGKLMEIGSGDARTGRCCEAIGDRERKNAKSQTGHRTRTAENARSHDS